VSDKDLYMFCSFMLSSDIKDDGLALVYIDRYVFTKIPVVASLTLNFRHLVHEVTSPQAFEGLCVELILF